MEVKTSIKKPRSLKDFTRLLIAFVCCLAVLSLYQQFSLFYGGVIDRIFNKTFYLLLVNHLGFSAILSFILLLVFRFLEKGKPGMGFRATLWLFSVFLLFEAILIENFINNYTLLHLSDIRHGISLMLSGGAILKFCAVLLVSGLCYFLFYKISWFANAIIGKMFPFTIVLFLMTLGTSVTDKRPINLNKSFDFITDAFGFMFSFEEYEGAEYPLITSWEAEDTFPEQFKPLNTLPNIVIVTLDGLSSEYLVEGRFAGFTPFLDSIANKSLYWNRFLANSTSNIDAVTNILGSLPQGESGFTNLEHTVNRNTLFGLLKANGYKTGFYFGGNATLRGLSKFLDDENVDIILDKSRFNDTYKLQEADRAGVTLGYPDGELYKKWGASYFPSNDPRIEFFLNLSTTKPFSTPNAEEMISKVREIMGDGRFQSKDKRFIKNNLELFAAIVYADTSLQKLFDMYAMTKGFDDTIFVITGSGKSYIPGENMLKEYQVPLLVYSNRLKKPEIFQNIASHHDIAPSLIHLLRAQNQIELPTQAAWMGGGLMAKQQRVVLSEANSGIHALVLKDQWIHGRKVMDIDAGLEVTKSKDGDTQTIEETFEQLKVMNRYVTMEDKILPKEDAIYETGKKRFTEEELVWVSSVFNGKNYDNAYTMARKLAHEGNYDKALLLSAYILENAPGHIDALILQGRIYAWKKHYNKSIALLEEAVDLHPFYHDGYSALLDVYYWSGNSIRASHIYGKIKENEIGTVELIKKVERCMDQLGGIEETDSENRRLVDVQFKGS